MFYHSKKVLELARECDIMIAKGNERNLHKQGLRLVNPTERELINAIETAVKDMIEVIYIHNGVI